MGVLLRKGSRIKDETTSSLVHSGVYHLADTYDDEEAKKFEGPVVYSFWSAVKYTFTLSLLLWWLPIFGQMIAGYVGGRRAGAPWKGMLAALVPVIFIFVISGLVRLGVIPTVIFGVDLSPGAVAAVITANVPVIQPYVDFVNMYLTNFFTSLHSTANLGLDSYVTTVAFAYIGGVLSQQTRRELELLARMSRGNNTTVVLEGNTFTAAESAPKKRGRGFEDLDVVGAAQDDSEEEPTPLRSAQRHLYDENKAGSLSNRDRKALRERAQAMAHDQRGVERKVQRRAADDEEAPPRHKAGGDKKDWEFI